MPQKNDVEEGNKIIAEFMQHPFVVKFKKLHPESEFQWELLKYHSSWDWLQPAWSKFYILCEKEFRSNETLYNQFADFRDNYNIHANHNNISAACETLVEAIQWYNQTNPQ